MTFMIAKTGSIRVYDNLFTLRLLRISMVYKFKAHLNTLHGNEVCHHICTLDKPTLTRLRAAFRLWWHWHGEIPQQRYM